MAETLPIYEELSAFIDTDVEWNFPVEDKDGVRIGDLTGWEVDFEIADSVTKVPKLSKIAVVITDPEDVLLHVLQVKIADTEIQPGSTPETFKEKTYVYSLKRINDTVEKILRYGDFHMHRARRSVP